MLGENAMRRRAANVAQKPSNMLLKGSKPL
jgi:hypothetical protein